MTSSNVENLIEVSEVSFRYGEQEILDQISFAIGKGEIVSMIGPNGSGKSTLLKIIIGLLPPGSGQVKIGGQKPDAAREQIAYVPQSFVFDRGLPLSVSEFMGLDDCGHRGHGRENIKKSLEEVGLLAHRHKRVGELSGGQFQRMMIARALLHEKSILAFDEPLSGIDIAGESTVYDLITKVNRERQATCIIVSHDLSVVNHYSSQVICINKSLCCHGRPSEVLDAKTIASLYGEPAGLYHQH